MAQRTLALRAALAVGALIPSLAYGAPNLVTNPSFELGTTGWTFAGCAGVPGGGPTHSGALSAELNFCGIAPDTGSMSQSIATTPGDLYAVGFWFDPQTGGGGGSFQSSFGADIGWSATNPTNPPFTPYVNITYDAVATGASSLFQIASTATVSGTYWFDDVSVMDLGPVGPSVPEPGSLALLLGGLAGLGLTRRARRIARG